MNEAIDPIRAEMRLTELLGDDFLAQAPAAPAATTTSAPIAGAGSTFTGNLFDDILSQAIKSLDGVSQNEFYTNDLVSKYIKGQAQLEEVMVAQSKLSILAQLAVTTVNSAVTTFKEVTQMQI